MKTRLVFMGSDPISLPSLNFLADEAAAKLEIVGVFSQPDRPTGRGKKLKANEIKQWALSRDIEVRQPERPGEADVEWLREKSCDLILVMAYGHILRRKLLDLPRLGTYNLHASLLPKYRGASPIPAAIASGDRDMGVTLMRMVRRMDAGSIVDQEAFPVQRRETGESATGKVAAACVPLLARNLDGLLDGQIPLREQNETEVSYTRKLDKHDGAIDFSASAERLARRINALHPWPGAFIVYGDQRLKVGLADWNEKTAAAAPGTVLTCDRNGLQVATASGILFLLFLQRSGGRMLPAVDFVRGFEIPLGSRLVSFSMPALVSSEPFASRRS